LGDKLSVTIIATGFQTKDEREKEQSSKKVVSMLVPEEAPMVRPVNEFINPVKAEAPAQPYIKPKEELKQTGLFDLFAKTEETDGVIKHSLMAEEPKAVEPEGGEFTFKVTESVMSFEPIPEQPVMQQEPQSEPEPEPIVGADDHKTDESIEEQLRKSRERIMRLKDLSMKLRNGNIQELENIPAYKRKEIALQQTPASDETQVSRFTLLSDNDGNTEIRNNNSFLHDNVD
jgi:cell division protein FtsZ